MCIEGKNTGLHFVKKRVANNQTLEIMHANVCDPTRTTSMGGVRNFVTLIDFFSKNVWLYELKSKGEFFQKFQALIETQLEHKIKLFWLDNIGEFVSETFERFSKDHDI